jgi:hypothetical protein
MSVDALVAVAKRMVRAARDCRLDVEADLVAVQVLAAELGHAAWMVEEAPHQHARLLAISPTVVRSDMAICLPDFAMNRLGRPVTGDHVHVGVDKMGVRIFSDADVGDIAGGRLEFGEKPDLKSEPTASYNERPPYVGAVMNHVDRKSGVAEPCVVLQLGVVQPPCFKDLNIRVLILCEDAYELHTRSSDLVWPGDAL